MSGRHLILLGIIACAGLLSVHDGQIQTDLCYKLAAMEKDLREVRSEIDLCKIKHRSLQSPRAITTRAAELQLKVAPAVLPSAEMIERQTQLETSRSLGQAQGGRTTKCPPVIINREGRRP